jgi:hypothetical protein
MPQVGQFSSAVDTGERDGEEYARNQRYYVS